MSVRRIRTIEEALHYVMNDARWQGYGHPGVAENRETGEKKVLITRNGNVELWGVGKNWIDAIAMAATRDMPINVRRE